MATLELSLDETNAAPVRRKRRLGALFRGDLVESGEDAHATRVHVPWNAARAARALGEVGLRAIFAGQESRGQRDRKSVV